MFSYLNPYIYSVRPLNQGTPTEQTSERSRILYSRSATFTVELAHESVKFYKNSFLYLPPHTPCTLETASHATDAVEILFDLYRGGITEGREEKKSPLEDREIWFADAMHLIEELDNLYAIWQSEEPFFEDLCSAKLKIILLKMLSSDIGAVHGATTMRIRRALRYIEAHYAEQITNEEIAESVGLHPYYLSRLVKKECGVSLHRYLMDYRLSVGASMLEAGEDNVENVSAQCGFTYCSHFINAFRSRYGMSPRRYTKTHSNRK